MHLAVSRSHFCHYIQSPKEHLHTSPHTPNRSVSSAWVSGSGSAGRTENVNRIAKLPTVTVLPLYIQPQCKMLFFKKRALLHDRTSHPLGYLHPSRCPLSLGVLGRLRKGPWPHHPGGSCWPDSAQLCRDAWLVSGIGLGAICFSCLPQPRRQPPPHVPRYHLRSKNK